jgi:hypothetical protein
MIVLINKIQLDSVKKLKKKIKRYKSYLRESNVTQINLKESVKVCSNRAILPPKIRTISKMTEVLETKRKTS